MYLQAIRFKASRFQAICFQAIRCRAIGNEGITAASLNHP
jgi:hypothetical protein